MNRYDVEQRVNVIAGPHRWKSGLTVTHYDPSDPESRAPVRVRIDASEVEIEVMACELRPVVYRDASGLGDAT